MKGKPFLTRWLPAAVGITLLTACVMPPSVSQLQPVETAIPEPGADAWRQQWRSFTLVDDQTSVSYRALLPESFDPSKQYPVVLFLHGAGERGEDNNAQLNNGGALFSAHRSDFPAIVIFPQAPTADYWAVVEADRSKLPFTFEYPFTGDNDVPPTPAMQGVMMLSDWLSEQPYVDTQRMYLMGLSMGGMGSYELLARQPDRFAAAVIICGGANAAIADDIRTDLPVWAFHGGKDDIVIPRYSTRVLEGLRAQGNPVTFTLFEEANHNSWDPTFAEPELLPWLFSQHK